MPLTDRVLQPLPLNTSPASVASSSSTSTPAQKLAPIFTRSYSRPRPSHASTSAGPPSSPSPQDDERARKRVKTDHHDVSLVGSSGHMELDESDDGIRKRLESIQDYFVTTPLRSEHALNGSSEFKIKESRPKAPVADEGVWRRRRGRGVSSRSILLPPQSYTPTTPFLDTLVTRLNHDPLLPPSVLQVPSIHPWSYPRDHAPPLAVAFSHSAKMFSQAEAKARSRRRMIAVAAEEGGVRVVDVDEPVGMVKDRQGWFWRAHGNAVLDVKWSADDAKILTASGDHTARLHVLDGPTPRLIASLTGHEGSLKSCTFFDPTGSSMDASQAGTMIATTGRDGNILIYDVRTRGSSSTTGRRRRGAYAAGVPGFAPQPGGEIGPVMEIRGAHESGRRRDVKSISSVVALSTMPGKLASGAGHEGIVKIWDARSVNRASAKLSAAMPDPTATSPGKRVRGIQSMVEQPSTGDLHVLTAESRIHVIRPSAMLSGHEDYAEAIQPVRYTHPMMRSTFWMGLAFSPCGRYLASGSCRGGLMAWDTQLQPRRDYGDEGVREVSAKRLSLGVVSEWEREREVTAVDWGYDMVAACAEDSGTKIWRRDDEIARKLKVDPKMKEDYAGLE